MVSIKVDLVPFKIIDKAKPAVRQGRKATGFNEIAGLTYTMWPGFVCFRSKHIGEGKNEK
jgi:hypothetical protein